MNEKSAHEAMARAPSRIVRAEILARDAIPAPAGPQRCGSAPRRNPRGYSARGRVGDSEHGPAIQTARLQPFRSSDSDGANALRPQLVPTATGLAIRSHTRSRPHSGTLDGDCGELHSWTLADGALRSVKSEGELLLRIPNAIPRARSYPQSQTTPDLISDCFPRGTAVAAKRTGNPRIGDPKEAISNEVYRILSTRLYFRCGVRRQSRHATTRHEHGVA